MKTNKASTVTWQNPFDNQKAETYDDKTFGQSVKIRREQLDFTSKYVAEKIGMSQLYYCNMEKGLRIPPSESKTGIDYLERLANVLKLNSAQQITMYNMLDVTRSKSECLYGSFVAVFTNSAMEENWDNEK